MVEIHRAIKRLTAPAEEPVTTAEAKSWMNVDISSDDTMIASMVAAARLQAELYTGRTFVATQWQVVYDDFPDARDPILLPKPPLLFVKQIKYTDTDGVTQTWGDRIMEARVTPATVENTDVFKILVGGVEIASFTATDGTVANVTAGLETAWNTSTHDFVSGITAADQTTYLELKGATGQGFVVTTSTTDGGGADAQTLTVTVTQDESTLYTIDDISEPARIEPATTQSYKSTQDDVNAVQIDLLSGYGAASDVPENAKSAIKMMVADAYEHRESNLEIRLQENMAAKALLWGLRVLNAV
ncbi:MAG: phage head-tail connector protein [Planctomycetes bacterium]|nr:phage head-tail connector protein [Planctomycetota bacterium]